MRLLFIILCLQCQAFGPSGAWCNHARFFGGYYVAYGQPTAILPDGTGWSIGHVTSPNDLNCTLFWDGSPRLVLRATGDGIRIGDTVRRAFIAPPPRSLRMVIHPVSIGDTVLVYGRASGPNLTNIVRYTNSLPVDPGPPGARYSYCSFIPTYGDSGSLMVWADPATGSEQLVGLLAGSVDAYYYDEAHVVRLKRTGVFISATQTQ